MECKRCDKVAQPTTDWPDVMMYAYAALLQSSIGYTVTEWD